MADTYVRAPARSAAEAAAQIDTYLSEHDPRSRTPLTGIRPETAAEPVLTALARPDVGGDRLALLADLADVFRVQRSVPLLLRHARAPHKDFDGYRGRIAAVRSAATIALSPAQAPEEGHRILVELTAGQEAVHALPEVLGAFIAYAPARDLAALEQRLGAMIAALDAAGQTDDGARLQARGVEDFSINDIPRARMAVAIMEEIRRTQPVEARLDALTAIHVGEDLRFREHLAPFAMRLLQDQALAGGADAVAAAFIRAHARASAEADKGTRGVRRAIAAQASAWFGAGLDASMADDATALPPADAGPFGTHLVPLAPAASPSTDPRSRASGS